LIAHDLLQVVQSLLVQLAAVRQSKGFYLLCRHGDGQSLQSLGCDVQIAHFECFQVDEVLGEGDAAEGLVSDQVVLLFDAVVQHQRLQGKTVFAFTQLVHANVADLAVFEVEMLELAAVLGKTQGV
jgi:hypothetical protein